MYKEKYAGQPHKEQGHFKPKKRKIKIPDDLSALIKVFDVDYSIPTSLASDMPYDDRSLTDRDPSTPNSGVEYNKQTGRMTVDLNLLYDWSKPKLKLFKFTLTRITGKKEDFELEISCQCCVNAAGSMDKSKRFTHYDADTGSISFNTPFNENIPASCQFGLKVTKTGDSAPIEMTDKLTYSASGIKFECTRCLTPGQYDAEFWHG